MKDKHIFFLFYHLGLGGIQRKIVDLVNHLEKNQEVITHIVVRRTEAFNFESDLPADFKQMHVENELTDQSGKLPYLFFLIYLTLEYKPKILVPFLHHTTAYCILIKYLFFWRKIKVVVSQDNMLSLENQLQYSSKTHSNLIIGWCYRRADKVIVMAECAKRDLVRNYSVDPGKVVVIQNWLKDAKLIKQPKRYDLIFCGRFAPQKKPVRLLQVVRLVKLTIPKVKLCLLGEGSEGKKLRAYIKKYHLENNVSIKPPTRDVIKEMAKSKLFVLTSDFEGHPLVLLEAMAQKVVPVSLSYPGAEEQIKHEENGYIEHTVKAMANRIIELLHNPEKIKVVGQRARQTILEHHNQTLMDDTLSVLLD